MPRVFIAAIFTSMLAACGHGPNDRAAQSPAPAAMALSSGLDLQYIDATIRPQDDFYRHVNGKWLATTEIPADKGNYGAFDKLYDDSEIKLRGIVESLAQAQGATDEDDRKIRDLYAAFLDEPAIEAAALKPLAGEFARIDRLADKKEIAALIAHLQSIGVSVPFVPNVHLDAKDSSKYVFDLTQDGLGLPDRDYYLLNDDKLKKARIAYAGYVQSMLSMSGDAAAAGEARQILALETGLATAHWTQVANRDPIKTYNKVPIAGLAALAPGYDWNAYVAESGVKGRTDYVIVSQPSYLSGFARLLKSTPLPVWKAYFRWHVLNDFAPYLPKRFVDARFAFYGTVLRGIPENRPRWKRGIALIERCIGEGLGKLYVAKYFPPESKARMDRLVQNLLAAYKADIETLDWMGPETRRKAQEKLAKFTPKIGYPKRWRDYGALEIGRDDLIGDVVRASAFEYQRNVNKLGKPVDREEWDMTPQTVNAYYNPEMNEIVFPAAILQPPFFDLKADDAVLYGGIGGIIGHEISHGFDDQGSQYDGDGNLLAPPGWFTQEDLARFKSRTRALVEQYAAYEPVPGYHVNGELTLGENIADNSGLAIAYKAYQLSLAGSEAPVLDGMSGDQRFYAGWAQAFRGKTREDEAIVLIKTDPHSPDAVRGTVPEMNQDSFYDAYGVKEGDKMYRRPQDRVTLW